VKRAVLLLAAVTLTAVAAPATAQTSPGLAPKSPGWVVVALSLATGIVVTSFAATIHCERGDKDCTRWASLGLWGGIGVAAGGTYAGLLIVERDVRSQGAPVTLRLRLRF
jgi:hypothetical protein